MEHSVDTPTKHTCQWLPSPQQYLSRTVVKNQTVIENTNINSDVVEVSTIVYTESRAQLIIISIGILVLLSSCLLLVFVRMRPSSNNNNDLMEETPSNLNQEALFHRIFVVPEASTLPHPHPHPHQHLHPQTQASVTLADRRYEGRSVTRSVHQNAEVGGDLVQVQI